MFLQTLQSMGAAERTICEAARLVVPQSSLYADFTTQLGLLKTQVFVRVRGGAGSGSECCWSRSLLLCVLRAVGVVVAAMVLAVVTLRLVVGGDDECCCHVVAAACPPACLLLLPVCGLLHI